MARKRKRAPGGGRKPTGPIHGKTEAFSTRIKLETRKALLAEKKRTGQSVSQIAEQMIELGLQTMRERERDNPMLALGFLIDQLVIRIADLRNDKDYRWRTDPFLFRSLQEAIHELMNRLAPAGKPVASSDLREGPLSTPHERGGWAVESVWSLFLYSRTGRVDWTKSKPVPAHIIAKIETTIEAFERARTTLTHS
jgi:hypothetical protein